MRRFSAAGHAQRDCRRDMPMRDRDISHTTCCHHICRHRSISFTALSKRDCWLRLRHTGTVSNGRRTAMRAIYFVRRYRARRMATIFYVTA